MYFAIHVIRSSTIYPRECDILALLWDFFGFVQMIVVKTILIGLGMIRQPTINGIKSPTSQYQ
jgi:hypothetical protein